VDLKVFMVDTHVHTCLSPCAELDMHPAALIHAAVQAGLDSIAVCDHNSVENAAAVQRAGVAAGISVIPGMEITSAEEVHILGLCPDMEAAMALQSKVYRALPGHNDENVFGMQVIANEFAEVLGFNDHLLAGATTPSMRLMGWRWLLMWIEKDSESSASSVSSPRDCRWTQSRFPGICRCLWLAHLLPPRASIRFFALPMRTNPRALPEERLTY
jgi:hypothetical protein